MIAKNFAFHLKVSTSLFLLNDHRFLLNDGRNEIRVLSILITITEKETGREFERGEEEGKR